MISIPPALDGLIITKPENIYHRTGFKGSFGLFIQPQKGKGILCTDGRYAEKAKALANKNNFRFQLVDQHFKKKFGKKITGTFGVEDSASLAKFSWLKKTFPSARFRTQKYTIEHLRRTKTPQEIQLISKAQNHIDKILVPFFKANAKSGVTEQELVFKFEHLIRNNGEFEIAFPTIVAFGPNSAIPHHEPNETKLRPHTPILIDCGAKYKGYHSDITRMFFFGNPTPEFQNQYLHLLSAQTKTLAKYKAAQKTKALDQYCRKQLGKDEKYFTHGLGHGVGLEIHELPSLSSQGKNYTLTKNDVVTCEPGLYYPGKYGMRIEDLVVVKEDGATVLSQTEKELIII